MSSNTAKAHKGVAMEGVIANWYAKNTGRDRNRFAQMARLVIEKAPAGGAILEVAPGPGYLAVSLAQSGFQLSAVDISRSFVELVRENAHRAGVRIDVRHGNAASLPFAEESFDFIVCSAAFKNFADPLGALNEMHRVLKVGGQASIFDLRKNASPQAIDEEVRKMNLSLFSSFATRFIFRFGLLRRAYTPQQMETMARQSRFGRGEVRTDGIGMELCLTKN